MPTRSVCAAGLPLVSCRISSLIANSRRACATTVSPRWREADARARSCRAARSRAAICSRLIWALTAGWVTPSDLRRLGEAAQIDDRDQRPQQIGRDILHLHRFTCPRPSVVVVAVGPTPQRRRIAIRIARSNSAHSFPPQSYNSSRQDIMAHQHCKFACSGLIPLAKNAIPSIAGFLEGLSPTRRRTADRCGVPALR